MGGSTRSKRTWPWVLLLVIVAAVVLICVPIIRHRRELSGRLICQARLKHLGTSLKLYMADHPDWWPQSSDAAVQALLDAGAIPTKFYDRPNGGERYTILLPATKPDAEPTVVDARVVWAYEPLSNHAGEGGNMLFMDGHAEFVRAARFEPILAESRRQLGIDP